MQVLYQLSQPPGRRQIARPDRLRDASTVPPMGLLDGQRAFVTGGASGIGAATCRRMAAEGARVAVVDIDEDARRRGRRVDRRHRVRGRRHRLRRARTRPRSTRTSSSAASRCSTTTRAAARWPRSTTGTSPSGSASSRSTSPACSTASRRSRRSSCESGGGAIVSTASISGTRPAAGEAPYAAAKAAVAALTASAALEYAPTIRVNAVSPGMIATPLTTLLLEKRGLGREEHMIGQDAARPGRHARRHRRRRGVPVLRPRPLRHRPEHRDRRRDDPARSGRRRRARHRARAHGPRADRGFTTPLTLRARRLILRAHDRP